MMTCSIFFAATVASISFLTSIFSVSIRAVFCTILDRSPPARLAVARTAAKFSISSSWLRSARSRNSVSSGTLRRICVSMYLSSRRMSAFFGWSFSRSWIQQMTEVSIEYPACKATSKE